MAGSFIPDDASVASSAYRALLEKNIELLLGSGSTNPLDLSGITDLKITKGGNYLDTCFQHEVWSKDNEKLLNVKAYDKIMDLFGREGSHQVGSRISTVLGCKRQSGAFEKAIRMIKFMGMTRLEISICSQAI